MPNAQVSVFEALPTDFMGALVDDADLRRRTADLLRLAGRCLDARAETVAVAAALGPPDNVFEGDPRNVTGRQRELAASRI